MASDDLVLGSDFVPAFLRDVDETPCRWSDVFTPDGYGRAYADQVELARRICQHCPVREACAEWAIERPSLQGIWGGTTPRERKDERRRRREDTA